MKKLFTFLTMMMAVTTTTLFTSCDTRFWVDDEDREEARTLEGPFWCLWRYIPYHYVFRA